MPFMLKAQDSLIAYALKQRVQAITPVERVIVFGSRARGDNDKESDLDVFIELPELTPKLHQQIIDIAWEIGFENGLVISIFLTSTASLTNSPLAANPILRSIAMEGVVI
jgi:uncharacterized protein